MTETTIYALPDEPKGPVWDRYGTRWTPTDVDGWWISDLPGGQCSWARVLQGYGPLTSVPPWKPEAGDIVETEEQYAALPLGSVVVGEGYTYPFMLTGCGERREWDSVTLNGRDACMAGTPRTILRVGWSL